MFKYCLGVICLITGALTAEPPHDKIGKFQAFAVEKKIFVIDTETGVIWESSFGLPYRGWSKRTDPAPQN
ncbi:MAG: hypothetical protein H0X51_08235 [Parachlamydiaceae bacterium]|nr:hypothetical protein [Parachlamydiaceae bacterium]